MNFFSKDHHLCTAPQLFRGKIYPDQGKKTSAKIPGPSLYEVLVPSQLLHVIAAQIRRYRYEPTHQPENININSL